VLAENGGGSVADIDPELVGREHLRSTVAGILHASELISDAVAAGRVGIVGANYKLTEGTATPIITVGIDTPGAEDVPATLEGSQ
jgi:carbonic anhydrase